MKLRTTVFGVLAVMTCFILISWGVVGHRTVALIAEKYLTPQAKAGIAILLNGQSLADVSTWADEVRNDPEYKNTASWHYLNLPLGLSHDAFNKELTNPKDNVYIEILRSTHVLQHQVNPTAQRAVALKFLVHLIGDAHQPMHISRREDKGGNTIQVQFDGKGTNLHSLWDSKLIGRQGLTDVEMAKQFDTATPTQIKQWQHDDVMQWLWESYQISSKLYGEVEQNNKLDDKYYSDHLPIVKQRIEMAGIRLAGILNEVFKDTEIKPSTTPPQSISTASTNTAKVGIISVIDIKDIATQLGQTVQVASKVYGTKDLSSMILVNLGAAYPNQLLTVVLRGDAKSLANDLEGKTVRVTGKIEEYRGKPQIVVTDPKNIQVSK